MAMRLRARGDDAGEMPVSLAPLPSTPGGFRLIVADPATDFRAGRKGRPQHYERMTDHEIASMPVASVAAPDCWLMLWVTSPKLYRPRGSKTLLTPQEIAEAWGFRFSGRAFVWIKTHPRTSVGGDPVWIHRSSLHKGMGYTTRKNAEDVLLFRRGAPARNSRSVEEIIIAPRREHSRKPDEFYERAIAFAGDVPRLELFARESRFGFIPWGNEAAKFDEVA